MRGRSSKRQNGSETGKAATRTGNGADPGTGRDSPGAGADPGLRAAPPAQLPHSQDPIRVLILEEDPRDAGIVRETLDRSPYPFTVSRVGGWGEFVRSLRIARPDAVLSAYSLTGRTGLDALRHLRESGLRSAFILVTGTQPEEVAVECMKAGADDYVLKSSLRRLPGAVVNAVWKHRHQSARETAEEELHRQRDLYDTLLTAQSDAGLGCAIISERSRKFLYVNDALCRISGYSPEELRNLPTFLALIGPEFTHRIEACLRRRRSGHPHPDTLRLTLRHRDGTRVDVEATVKQPRIDGDTRLVALVRDITVEVRQSRSLEEALRSLKASEEKFRLLLEGVRDYAIVMIDPNGLVVSWNAGAGRIFGYTPGDILGESHLRLYAREEAERGTPRAGIAEAAATGRSVFAARAVRRDGSVFRAETVINALYDGARRTVGFSTVIRDLTEASRIEDRLRRQREELGALASHLQVAREEERVRMARELHDELSQALTAFRMDLSILRHKVAKTVDPEARTPLIDKIVSMSALVEATIQSVRRIISELRPTALDEFGITTAIQWHVQEFEKRSGIRCMIPRLQRDVEVSPEQATALFRIVQEALTNVARHAGASRAEVTLEERGGEIVLTVRDNGSGIDTGRIAGGKSFGLLGMRERVRLLGGSVEIHGVPGKGTTVSVRIPVDAVRQGRP